MEDFIALRCPSCGGHIQVEKNLEKIFCTHCGTQLLLKQGADGLLTPMMARDLTASATLKETQTALMVIDLLKSQIKELEEQSKNIRHAFFQYCVDYIAHNATLGIFFIFRDGKLFELINRYTQQATNRAQLTQETYNKLPKRKSGTFPLPPHAEDWEALNIPGLNTLEDFFRLYQFINQPQISQQYGQYAKNLICVLQPITQIGSEWQEKKQRLKKAMDSLTSTNSGINNP